MEGIGFFGREFAFLAGIGGKTRESIQAVVWLNPHAVARSQCSDHGGEGAAVAPRGYKIACRGWGDSGRRLIAHNDRSRLRRTTDGEPCQEVIETKRRRRRQIPFVTIPDSERRLLNNTGGP